MEAYSGYTKIPGSWVVISAGVEPGGDAHFQSMTLLVRMLRSPEPHQLPESWNSGPAIPFSIQGFSVPALFIYSELFPYRHCY